MITATLQRSLQDNEVHVWFLRTNLGINERLRSACESILDDAEQIRYSRFRFAKDATLFLSAHAFLRILLSSYTGINPRRLHFTVGTRGRPEVAPGLTSMPLRFNLSHTPGLVACAIALKRAVGVDVERLDRAAVIQDVARRWFSSYSDVITLAALEPSARRQRSVDLWVLREALLKGLGIGLSTPTTQVNFRWREDGQVMCSASGVGVASGTWRVALLDPTDRHRGGLAFEAAPLELVEILGFVCPADLAIEQVRAHTLAAQSAP